MCGVPFHAAEGYITKLVQSGLKVAICEQLEDASQAKGMVARDVVRVVTPGTVIDSAMLPNDKNIYLASICYDGKEAGRVLAGYEYRRI